MQSDEPQYGINACEDCPMLNNSHDPHVYCGHPTSDGAVVPDWQTERLFASCPLKNGPLLIQLSKEGGSQ